MKRTVKRLCAGALAAVLATGAISLTACGDKTETDAEGNVIVTMSLMNSTNENPGWLAMIDAANEVLKRDGEKVRIEAEIIKTDSWDQYYTKVTSNMLGKIGGTIGRIAESHIPAMVDKRQLADLTDVRDALVATGEYDETAFDGVAEKDGAYFGLPTGTQHMVMYYNKTIFDEYNAANPTAVIEYPSGDWNNASTFAEILDASKKITDYYTGKGNKKFGLSAGPFLAYAGMYAKNSGGVNIFDDNGECKIDTQPFYDVYDWFTQMLVVDKSMPNTSDTQTLDAAARFLGGNIAMLIDGVWQMHDVCKYTESYEIGIAAIPVSDKKYASYTTTFTDRFWAARNSRHPEEDKIALKALMSKEAITALGAKQIGGIPIRPDCRDNYFESIEGTKLAGYADVVKSGITNKANVPYTTYYNIVDQQINQKMALWINGTMSAKEFVDFMATTMRSGMEGKL